MKWRPVVWFLVAALAVTASVVSAQPRRTITLWYPAGDIAAGPVSPFTDPNLFANFEATNNVRVEMVGVDYDTMVQKIFAAAAGRNIADILFIDTSWLPGFLKEDLLQQMDSAKARKWLADVVPDVVDLSDYGNGTMWGYPQMGYDIYGLTWNNAQFKEAGLDPERPPGTWDELRDYGNKLAKRDPHGKPVRKVGDRPGVLLGGWLFAVPKSAKNSELAWKSMDWLNSEINDYTIARRFELTPRYKANWAKDPFKSDSYDQALVKIARYGRRLPINLGLNGVLDSLGFAIQKALHGEATPEQAFLEAERLAQKAIDEAAK